MAEFRDSIEAHTSFAAERARKAAELRVRSARLLGEMVDVFIERGIEPLPVYHLAESETTRDRVKVGMFRTEVRAHTVSTYERQHRGWLLYKSDKPDMNDIERPGHILTADATAYTAYFANLITGPLTDGRGVDTLPAIVTSGKRTELRPDEVLPGTSFNHYALQLIEAGDQLIHASNQPRYYR